MSQAETSVQSASFLGRAQQWVTQSLTQENQISAYLEPLIQMAVPGWTTDSIRSRVLQVRPETNDVYTLVIRPGKRWKSFTAGQHLQITAEQNGSLQTRFFSISSAPAYFKKTGLIEMSIRVQEGGRVTPWLREAFAAGGICTLSPAEGEFVLPAGNQPLLMVAGGSGITPFRSMLSQMAASGDKRDAHLLFYVRDEANALFKDEFERIAAEHDNIRITFMNSAEKGVFSAEHLQQECPDFAERKVMICGPTPMIQLVRSVVAEQGVSADNIMFEYFGAAPIELDRGDAKDAYVNFEKGGVAAMSSADQPVSLLELAEQNGLKPLAGCRVGVCHQCKCTKKSGVVLNTLTGQYSDTGKEDIQLCISVAVNDVVLDV
ncbi:MAG: ferredoxin reductase [Pseudomonadota bacterium]|nr:ferredoxin reductase [Pseudomonadota bacterium]